MSARQNESGRLGRLVKPIGKTVKIGELGLARRLLRRGVHVGLPSSCKYRRSSAALQRWLHGYNSLQTARAIQRLDIGICVGPQPHSVINDAADSSRFVIRPDDEPARQTYLISDRATDTVTKDCDGQNQCLRAKKLVA
jgi:hypothetical protein